MNRKTTSFDPVTALRDFVKLESASGILLVIAGALALVAANSPLAPAYDALLQMPIRLQVGTFELDKTLLIWINDLLMAIFFLLVGLEIKREVVAGELADRAKVALPGVAALGGMIVPAAIYAWLNWNDPVGVRGWAIPSATDIAFALGVLSLFGERVPLGLKVFLMTLAVLDDLGAIVIIALFYTSDLSLHALALAALAIVVLFGLNRSGVTRIAPYVLVGVALWVCVLKSGVHATLAGVVAAMFVPAFAPHHGEHAPASRLEHSLHPWVAFGILPLFAFANAGVGLHGLSVEDLLDPIPLGIMLGLFLGKQVGVFTFAWLAVKARVARLPDGVTFGMVYGAAILCGIGFTMSLFIGMLAFENAASGEVVVTDRLGILAGTFLSASVGALVLHWVLPRANPRNSNQAKR
ncbi:MAG TPA: Na+/H+ antiporter NhaA [Steroidobacteraceae bacterium]|nr:Na+/H+ antiporter NhaA [Steroidobacteraceae bacterium]